MRLIDADALKAVIEEEEKGLETFEFQLAATACINHIEEAPTVDAEPVRYAVWLTDGSIGGHCSICGEECAAIEWNNDDQLIRPVWDYCPGCGAKMIGGKE